MRDIDGDGGGDNDDYTTPIATTAVKSGAAAASGGSIVLLGSMSVSTSTLPMRSLWCMAGGLINSAGFACSA